MSAVVLWGSVIGSAIALAQSSLFGSISIAGARPDLVLILLMFLGNKNGMMAGQLVGVVVGIVLDVLGLAPLGFHVLIYGLIGALFGVSRGKVFVDPVIIPILFGAVAVLLRGLFGAVVAALFSLDSVFTALFTATYWIELGYTAFLTPLFFALLGVLPFLQPDRRRGETF